MILNDYEILELCKSHNMISPYVEESVKTNDKGEKILSYGVSSFGYDVRPSDEWYVFSNTNTVIVDPKNFSDKAFTKVSGDGYVIIPPNSFVLTSSVEYMKIPNDVMCLVQGKSTLARVGISCPVTPLEPAWEGHITLEFCNNTPLPVKMYANEGACQIVFFKGNRPATTYADRLGKYQGQRGITLPKV